MALMTDKKTTNKLNDRLTEFSKYGMTFYYLIEEGRIDIKDLEEIFFSKDEDKSTFMYINTMRKIMPEDVEKAFLSYQDNYPRGDKTLDEHREELNVIYTAKIIDDIVATTKVVDKTYINTYNYLLNGDVNLASALV